MPFVSWLSTWFSASLFTTVANLLKGTIGITGNIITLEHESGEKFNMTEPEEIHTYQKWQSLGYQVKKGQKEKATFLIWQQVLRSEQEQKSEYIEKMIMVKESFFTVDQVEKIE